MKKLTIFMILLIASLALYANIMPTDNDAITGTDDDGMPTRTPGLQFTLINNDTEYSVSKGNATGARVVVIPETYNFLPVTVIGDAAFANCSLASIIIPASVTSIGSGAFSGCRSLTNITLPSELTSIGNSAFQNCYSLTTIEIPASMTSIGNVTFNNCSSLTTIEIPASVTSIGIGTFNNCSSLTSISIPASVTSIGGWAFSGCSNLSSITVDVNNTVYRSEGNCLIQISDNSLVLGCQNSVIPTSVTSIGYVAFSGSSLTTIYLPTSVTSIEDGAFYECISLATITIPASVTSIGYDVFWGCSSSLAILTDISADQVDGLPCGIHMGSATLVLIFI